MRYICFIIILFPVVIGQYWNGLTSFQQRYVDTIEIPFNTLVPKQEARITYASNRARPLRHNQRILAEKTLLRPTATWPTAGYTGLYTVVLADVSIRSNASAIQWIVTNIKGNNIAGGEEVMEYVSPIAWRNCFNGTNNHNEPCNQSDGLIDDPTYIHRNVLYVFRQFRGRMIRLARGERNTGCQLNLQSSFSNMGTWDFNNLNDFIAKYKLSLYAATWYTMPYSDMVGSILCQYHACYGNTLSQFLAGAPNLAGITTLDVCGRNITYSQNSAHPLSVDNGDRNPIDWSMLLSYQGTGAGFSGDWNEWSAWSSCDRSCGIGTKSRIRTCNRSKCQRTQENQERVCKIRQC